MEGIRPDKPVVAEVESEMRNRVFDRPSDQMEGNPVLKRMEQKEHELVELQSDLESSKSRRRWVLTSVA